jgi:tripartite ATP-independent transporter DctM subunit
MIIALLFISFLVFLFMGMPVAFSLAIPTVLYFFLLGGNIPIEFMAHSMTTPLFNYVLIALPAFLLSGRMMNSTGVTDRLFDAAVAVVGRFRGGLAHANVFASMLFASMSGTAVGDAGGLGQVEMQMMEKAHYRKDFAAGITAASSILGPIIPPSVSMVILGATAEISIGRLFMAGIIPGVIMAVALMLNIALRAHSTAEGKSWPVEKVPAKQAFQAIRRGILPMLCPVIIIGSISAGIVTPTEAAVLAIDYALLLGLVYHEISWKSLWKTLEDTVVTTVVFMYIIAIAGFFTWVVTREGLPIVIKGLLAPLMSFSPTTGLILIAIFLLIVGCFLDTTAAILLVAPVLMPIVRTLGIDVIHFGIIMTVALLIGIITPPFGICLFVLSEVADLSVAAVTKEAIRYLPAMVIVLLVIIFFPEIVLFVPRMVFGG